MRKKVLMDALRPDSNHMLHGQWKLMPVSGGLDCNTVVFNSTDHVPVRFGEGAQPESTIVHLGFLVAYEKNRGAVVVFGKFLTDRVGDLEAEGRFVGGWVDECDGVDVGGGWRSREEFEARQDPASRLFGVCEDVFGREGGDQSKAEKLVLEFLGKRLYAGLDCHGGGGAHLCG